MTAKVPRTDGCEYPVRPDGAHCNRAIDGQCERCGHYYCTDHFYRLYHDCEGGSTT